MSTEKQKQAIEKILKKVDAGEVEEEKKGLLNKILSWYLDENCKDDISLECIDDACKRAFAQSLSAEASIFRRF